MSTPSYQMVSKTQNVYQEENFEIDMKATPCQQKQKLNNKNIGLMQMKGCALGDELKPPAFIKANRSYLDSESGFRIRGSKLHVMLIRAINVALAAASGTIHKAPAVWSKAEESIFLNFLLLALPSSGDGGFKMATFNQASVDLKLKYPHQRGTEKTGVVCKNKFTALKKAYYTVVEIKCTSGFMLSNEHGTHPYAKPFIMKGFNHFKTMEQLVPSKAKGLHVFQPTATSNATPQDSTTSTSPLIPTAIDNALQGPPSSVDPDSLEVPAPSTFLCPSTEGSTNSVWTSMPWKAQIQHGFSCINYEFPEAQSSVICHVVSAAGGY
ncbi:uncharacterized protein F5147DRAFT_647601 [Suillus discolor]|uniref:Uncharacterized protein n=1 Tax=Suillus discolor TaxID=1912936 RepID=A0A9P7K0G0_9AGAM|nr:uncharacterized protein F5147DRAFT_647601 [Suillus discolor]KAG2119704.1 hypothetical protein F5147DRAFT_647601 [Suillus discolor]